MAGSATAAVIKRRVRQSWREAVEARAGAAGARGCLAAYDALVAEGRPDLEAAFEVLEARGLLWRLDEPSGPPQGPAAAATASDDVPAL